VARPRPREKNFGLHTPDFFVIRETSAGREECKMEEELNRLAETQPLLPR